MDQTMVLVNFYNRMQLLLHDYVWTRPCRIVQLDAHHFLAATDACLADPEHVLNDHYNNALHYSLNGLVQKCPP